MTKRLVDVSDFQKFKLATNPLLSPDGQWVVFEQTVPDVLEDGYTTQLLRVKADGSERHVLTSNGSNNSSASWSHDGKTIVFVSNRAFSSQAFLLSFTGGEARQLTRFRYGIRSLKFSPDGQTVYGLVPAVEGKEIEVFAADVTDKNAKEELEKENKDWSNGPKRIDHLRYKMDGAGFDRNRYSQLVSIDVATGEYKQLTSGSYDVDSFAVSPDGEFIVLTSNRTDNPDSQWWRSDLYRISTHGGDLLLLSDKISAHSVSFSPDGREIAVTGHGEELFTYWSAAHQHLFIVSSADGSVRHVTKDFPDTIGNTNLTDMRGPADGASATWSKDGKFLYALSTREGRCEVVRFDVQSAEFDAEVVIGGDRDIYGFAFDGVENFVLSYATQIDPSRLVTVRLDQAQTCKREFRKVDEPMMETVSEFFPAHELQIDDANRDLLDELNLVQPEAFYYTSQDGYRVQGWVLKPAEYKEGEKYPVILEIHGGPQLNYGYAIFHEMQWFAARGYAVVLTNPRGGMSYGQEFANGVRHHYGEGDAADVINGLDFALREFSFLDDKRVAITGGSYGGFMTNWLVGHTDRFFAAASQRSITNWISFFGVSDVGPLFCESQHGLTVGDWEAMWKISPLAYVSNVNTPLLLIHSENDLRCPIEQAEQFYTAIKRRGGEVTLVRIPNASHGLSRNGKPKLRVERLEAIFNYIHDRLPQ